MTIANLLRALSQGFTAKQALDWISRNDKKLGKIVRNALSQGYEPEKITEYLTKGKSLNYSQRQKVLEDMGDKERTDAFLSRGTDWEKLIKNGAAIAGTAAGAYGLARGLPALSRSSIGQNILSHLGLGSQQANPTNNSQNQAASTGIPTTSNQQTSSQQQPIPSQPNPLQSNSIQNTDQSQSASQSPLDSSAILREMQLEPKINNLLKSGNPPDIVSAVIDKTLTPGQKKFLDTKIKEGKAKSLAEMIGDYAQNPSNRGENALSPTQNEKIAPKVQPLDIPEKPTKGSIVSTPEGIIGELESERNGQALIKDDSGKLHKVTIKDLKLPNETVSKTVTRLLEIPEIDKSGPLNYWAYDEPDNEIFIMYHNGETYKYKDVPPDLVKELEEAGISPKTKGSNMFGAWSPEDKPEFSPQAGREILSRGATVSRLIINHPKYKKPKKGEEENPFYRKLRKGYDYWQALRG